MIYTFYSYKGGIGRSMALVNIAEFFARAGLRVLIVDWDLEAPGLERFFFSTRADIETVLSRRGIIDLLLDYKMVMSQKIELTPEGNLPIESINDDLLIDMPLEGGGLGKIRFLSAGRRPSGQFSAYAKKVVTFNWLDFYDNWRGEFYFERLRHQLNDPNLADIVLIDSRTGVTEMGGVCTYHLADTIIMLCGASSQSVDGTNRMGRNFKSIATLEARNHRELEVVVVPARVETRQGNPKDVDTFEQAVTQFNEWLPESVRNHIATVWDLHIPYAPAFAFNETITMRQRGSASADEINPSYISLAKVMAVISRSEILHSVFPELRGQQNQEITQDRIRLERFIREEKLIDAQQVLDSALYEHRDTELFQSMQRQVEGLRQKLLERVKSYQQYTDDAVKVNLGDLQGFITEIDKAIVNYPEQRELLPLRQGLQARADFIEGVQAYEEGQYARAKELLLAVDKDTARDLIKRLDEAQGKELELNQVIRQVHEEREKRQWSIAYDLLYPWNNIPLVPHLEARVRRELKDLTEKWEPEVIERLNRLARETPLEITTIRGYLDTLKKIGSSRLNEWERKVLGPYYAKIARERQKNGAYEGEGGCLIAWEEALRVDRDNTTYRDEQYKAEKAFAEVRIIANPKDYALMVQLYGKLIEKNQLDLDNHIKLADAYLRQKEFDKAENALDGAESVWRSNADTPGHLLVSLQEVKERWSREKDIALHQNSLLDKLWPDRKGYEYREALKEYQALLEKYPNENSNLKLWWEERIDNLEKDLENKTDEARRKTNLWVAAEPLLKLIWLRPEHAGMRRLLNEISDDLAILINAISEMIAEGRKKGDYLDEEGFGEVGHLQEAVQGYIALLRPHADKLPEWQTQLRTLEAQDARLAGFREQLQSIRTIIAQGYQAIEQAKRAGEWGKAEQIARQLQQSDVREAVPVVTLGRQFEQAKADHALFLTRLKAFDQAVQKNSFFEAQQLGQQIRQYYDDNKSVNPSTKEYRTKLHSHPVHFSQLQQLLQNYASEAEIYFDWLRPVLLIAPWRSANITVPLPRGNDLEGLTALVKPWLATVAASDTASGGSNQVYYLVQQMVKKGSFAEALALCADVVEASREQMEIQPFAGRYTLEFLRHRLRNRPVRGEWSVHELPIDEAERLGEGCLGQIHLWIQEVHEELQRISGLAKEFEQIRGEIKQRLRYFDQNLRFRRGKSIRDTLILCDRLSEISPDNKEVERFRSILRVF